MRGHFLSRPGFYPGTAVRPAGTFPDGPFFASSASALPPCRFCPTAADCHSALVRPAGVLGVDPVSDRPRYARHVVFTEALPCPSALVRPDGFSWAGRFRQSRPRSRFLSLRGHLPGWLLRSPQRWRSRRRARRYTFSPAALCGARPDGTDYTTE